MPPYKMNIDGSSDTSLAIHKLADSDDSQTLPLVHGRITKKKIKKNYTSIIYMVFVKCRYKLFIFPTTRAAAAVSDRYVCTNLELATGFTSTGV